MELRHLRYFTAVAAHGSFNAAAQKLHLTQPALSRQVRDLEEELKVQLLERGKNAVRLTDAGEIFYEEAREVLARADQAVRRVRGNVRGEVVRVGYAPSLTTGIIPAALERYLAVAPRVEVQLHDLTAREMGEMAREGRLDLVVAPETEIAGFQWTELRRFALVLVMPAGHPLAKLKRIAPARLRDIPLVGLGRDNFPDYVPQIRARLKNFGVVPRFATLVNDGLQALFAAVEANHAAAVVADGSELMMPRALVTRPFSPPLSEGLVKVGLPEVAPNPHAEGFARALREAARLKAR